MGIAIVYPSVLSGRLTPPPSNEMAIRHLWAACLGAGGAIGNCPATDDVRAILKLATQFGADIKFSHHVADILSPGLPFPTSPLTCYSNSRASRLAVPLAMLFGTSTSITGAKIPDSALAQIDSYAMQLDLRITKTSNELSVQGPPTNDWLELKNREGLYWASGFMMAFPLAKFEMKIFMDDFVASHPSTKLTINTLELFGIGYQFDEDAGALTIAAEQQYPPIYSDIENDYKTGSYFLGALAMAGDGQVILPKDSLQPQRNFWKIFEEAKILTFSPEGSEAQINSSYPLPLEKEIDIRHYPSLLPLAAVLATQSSHKITKIGPLFPVSPKTLARAKLISTALNALGANSHIQDSYLYVHASSLKGASVDCGYDGRVAMALALAGLVAKGKTSISGAEAASRICRNFWSDLKSVGAKISFANK